MCTENCCNHTRHAIFFFILLSFLLLANTDHVFKFHGNKGGDGDGGADGGSSPPLCTTTTATTKLTLTFLYGALFTLILMILSNNSGSPKCIEPDSQRARRAQFDVEPASRTLTMDHPTVDYYQYGGDGNEGGIGFLLLRTFPTFAYSVMRPQKMGKGCRVCVICQDKFKDGEMVRWLPDCDHLFHVCCVDEWLSSHKTCPCCRAVLDFTTSPTITSFNDQDHFYLDYFNEYY